LQWGTSAAGGGNYWAVASWLADGQGGPAFYSQLVQVKPGDVFVGVMTLTGQSPNGLSYNCEFQMFFVTSQQSRDDAKESAPLSGFPTKQLRQSILTRSQS
jgi:hypothetical protein